MTQDVQRVDGTVLFHHEERNGWWAESPQAPGCYAAGDTLQECARLWADAYKLWDDGPDGDDYRRRHQRHRPVVDVQADL